MRLILITELMMLNHLLAHQTKGTVLSVSVSVRVHLRLGMYHVLVLTELQWICGTGAQGDGSLLNALSRKCYMHMLQ